MDQVKGLLSSKFSLKVQPDSSLDKTKVICIYCHEVSYHRSTSPLKYQLLARHAADAESAPPLAKGRPRWTVCDGDGGEKYPFKVHLE